MSFLGVDSYKASMRTSRQLVLFIVSVALFLESSLTTVVVPIIPGFLLDIEKNKVNHAVENNYGEEFTENAYSNRTEGDYNVDLNTVNSDHDLLLHGNMETGFLFASKAVVQFLSNPLVGPLTDRVGNSLPLFFGCIILFASTLVFAFGESYAVLFFARSLQGIGSSLTAVAGMSLLAERYPDDTERGNAMGIAMAALALGLLIGPSFGGLMYEYVNKSSPFLILAGLALGDGLLQLLILRPAVEQKGSISAPSLKELVFDPYIMLAAITLAFSNLGIALLESSLPIHMIEVMQSSRLEQGLMFLAPSISFLLGTRLGGYLGTTVGRWKALVVGLFTVGVSLIIVPFPSSYYTLIPPLVTLGFAIGVVESCVMPELGHLADTRHTAVYGGVYAIADEAVCLGFALGPGLSGVLVKNTGFKSLLIGVGVACIMFSPLLVLLRNPPSKKSLSSQDTTKLQRLKTKKAKTSFDNTAFQQEQRDFSGMGI